jgi:transcriptional regulator with XRE-family HTH domain
LKEYRQHRGMTVRELADAAHVTPGQISRYEHGRDRISHERVTEFARILRIKSNDLYHPPGSRLRHNHVRWRLTNFMAAVIAEAAALMSSRRKVAAAADNEMLALSTAVAVAVSASAAAASSGEKISSLTSGDDAAAHDPSSPTSATKSANKRHMQRSKQHRYSITSSASASNLSGISKPSALAVLTFMTN